MMQGIETHPLELAAHDYPSVAVAEPKAPTRAWRDVLIIVLLAAATGFASLQGARRINPVILYDDAGFAWLNSDTPRVFANMTALDSNHYRTKVHPLFSLGAYPPVKALRMLGVETVTAVRIVLAAVASLWIGALFIVLRLIGCRHLDAALFSVLAASSASAVFWFVVPETYPFGSLTILLALATVALAQYRKLPEVWYVIASALTLSVTVTNWMAGIFATFASFHWRRASRITVYAFSMVVLLWGVQKFIFPTAQFFIGDRAELLYILQPESGGPLNVLSSFALHTMVMPAIEWVDLPDWPYISTQHSLPGSGSLWGAVAIGLWAALLVLGLCGLFSAGRHPRFRVVLGLTLLGQLLLHLVYGDETFLYALHFGPLLVVLTAFSTLTRARKVALALAALLTLCAGVNNGLQFNEAVKMLEVNMMTARHAVKSAMIERANDPWPRGRGHAVLAVPGTREIDKAYHEPGGSFSPAVGSFGVSIWMTDIEGNFLTSSDNIPLNLVRQQLVWPDQKDIPGVLSESIYYQTLWSSVGPGRWELSLKTHARADAKPMIVFRSVGPAGGAIRSLQWDGERLLINGRWAATVDPPASAAHLGEEGPEGWMGARSGLMQWNGDGGWGYARFELTGARDWKVVVEDSAPQQAPALDFPGIRSGLELDLPDERFEASLNSQVAHLMMGLVGRETRPGDPVNYPLNWLRDGAYVIVALARAGQLPVAKELSTYFAENDFFGGLGPEADAPGLAIWALEEVALRLNQPEYDRMVWPHVRRKANLILKMLSTDRPIRQAVVGPIVPKEMRKPDLSLVAEAARDGLIIGKMDGQRPLLYVNAVSYRGLLDAAALADRVNEPADAKRWRAIAAEMQQAWTTAFRPPESDNERSYIIWSTWVWRSDPAALLRGLQQRWATRRDAQGGFRQIPLWTYFDIAEAHLWLLLGRQDRAWATLHWFWDHQASPGLYTWWEGKGEESFRHWEHVRGWVSPPHITPHYWTAAEMLLLQLDMLAYVDEAAIEPTLIIGPGVLPAWLDRPMRVRGLSTRIGEVDWAWDGRRMHVKIHGNRCATCKVRLGAAFPPGTPLHVGHIAPERIAPAKQ